MRQTKQQYVYEYIKDHINSNEYPPGTALTEEEICETLNVSRTPVREAIRRLTSEDLLVVTAGIGLSVSNIGLEDLIEIYDVREALEGLSVKLFMERSTASSIQALTDIMDKQKKAFAANDTNGFMDSDMQFHRLLDSVAGNKRLSNSLDSIYGQINRLAYVNKDDPQVFEQALGYHTDVMNAILAGDKEKAVASIQEHVRSLKKYYLSKYFHI